MKIKMIPVYRRSIEFDSNNNCELRYIRALVITKKSVIVERRETILCLNDYDDVSDVVDGGVGDLDITSKQSRRVVVRTTRKKTTVARLCKPVKDRKLSEHVN